MPSFQAVLSLTSLSVTFAFFSFPSAATVTLPNSIGEQLKQRTQIRDQQNRAVRYLARRRGPRVKRFPGTSRGGLCALTPHADFEVGLLNSRPLLIWRGSIGAIEIHKPGEAKPIWRRVVQPQGPEVVNQVRYGGPVLQPGESYEWHFFKTHNSAGAVRKVQFQVLEQNLRGPVIRQLLRRDVELRQAGASLNEQLESRLDILEERRLWLDLLQEVNLASTRKALNPDDMQWLQELIAERCDNSVTSSASRIDNSRPESHIKSWMRSEK